MEKEPRIKTAAIIAAAGRGTRMAATVPKIMVQVGQRPILAHTLRAFEVAHRVDEVILVVAESMVGFAAQEVVDAYGFQKVARIIPGGASRQESVYAGLGALDKSYHLVAIHDGARPLITPQLIDSTVELAAKHHAVVVAVRPKDTIKRGEGDLIQATLDRKKLWQVQTPQVFRRHLILSAYQRALKRGFQGTDDASLVEAMGERVWVIQGRYDNIKITTPEDLIYMEMALRRRQGQ
jgi:2-C-methyl-D-erythritol 4-phosphate cytidylyltransferase